PKIQRGLQIKPPFFRNTLEWYLGWYPYLTGTDLMALMFSTIHRREWILLTTAKYKDGTDILLPLPRQSPRSFLQRTFFDNKEVKFQNNMYGAQTGRQMYAYYLCRAFPIHNGFPIQSIELKVHWREFSN